MTLSELTSHRKDLPGEIVAQWNAQEPYAAERDTATFNGIQLDCNPEGKTGLDMPFLVETKMGHTMVAIIPWVLARRYSAHFDYKCATLVKV